MTAQVELDSGPLMTVDEVMRLLRLRSRNTLWSWERRGHGPQPVNIGVPGAEKRVLRYRRHEVEQFIGANHE